MDLTSIQIIGGPIPLIVGALAVVAGIYLLFRRPSRRWVLTALIGIVAGVLVGILTIILVNELSVFGTKLPVTADVWIVATFAAIGLAIVNLWRSRWWRKVFALLAVLIFAAQGTVAINAYYGLTPTLGALFGQVTEKPIDIAKPGPVPTPDPTGPLYETWKPPADMPKQGKTGTQVIPVTSGSFDARPAGIYLPPAALVENPPALPLVVFMMGFPGTPDPQNIGGVLDSYAAKHDGLAPIVIVADQIGNKGDPACADSAMYGVAQSYITKDVVAWAKSNLRILQDRKYWTIGGYSNGGACSFKYAAQSPDVWGNLIVVSGDEFPGVEGPDAAVSEIFGGDQTGFEAAKPTNILAANPGKYSDMWAVFTVGGNDAAFVPGVERNSKQAEQSGMKTTYYVVPGAGHGVDAVDGGLTKAFEVLYPRLGLSAP